MMPFTPTEEIDKNTSNPIWIAAQSMADAGIPVFPCNLDKSPMTLTGFKDASTEYETTSKWFRGKSMIGVPTGAVTCLDIDAKHQAGLIEDFEEAMSDGGLSVILEQMPKQTTVNGGCHYFVRVQGLSDPIRNTKLAKNEQRDTIIETRGEGGYVCVAPSNGYAFERGSLYQIPSIGADVWQKIVSVAAKFDKHPRVEIEHTKAPANSLDDAPGDDYNRRGVSDMFSRLQSRGWRPCNEGKRWTRPGKDGGVSATWDSAETPNKFYVFSSNAHPFEDQQSYSPFAVYAILEHSSDFVAAAKALLESGYGKKSERKGESYEDFSKMMTDLKKKREEGKTELTDKTDIENDPLKKIYDDIQLRQYDHSKPVEQVPAMVTLNGTPIIRRGNISTLTAQTGAGKTHVLNSIIRALSSGSRALGFEGEIDGKVVYLDFEQSADDFDAAIRYQARIGANSIVKAHHLTGYGAKLAKAVIGAVLKYEADMRLLIIDGYADCVQSVNDDQECGDFVKDLLFAAQELEIAILGVLHLNPGSDFKSRGHLGSELDRKSETVMQITTDGEIREIWTSKARKKPIAKGHGLCFQWGESENGFVEIEGSSSDMKMLKKKDQYTRELLTVMAETDMHAWKYNDLRDAIMSAAGVKDRAAKSRISDYLDVEILAHNASNGNYTSKLEVQ